MYGSQPKLSSVVESSLTWDLFLGFYSQDFDLRQQSQWSLEKAAKIWGRHHWFLRKMTFGNDCRNFILVMLCVTTQIWVVLLIAIFPRHTTNQKHYPELGIGTSTVWNFCSHFSDVISQRNQCWCFFLRLSDGWVSHVGRHRHRCRLWKSKFKFFPHNLLLAAILDFGEGYKSCLFSFKVKKSRFKHKN